LKNTGLEELTSNCATHQRDAVALRVVSHLSSKLYPQFIRP